MSTRRTGGGAATHGGIRFQDQVAAWFAVGILAERDAEPPLGLGADVHLEWLGCECGEPLDDINVRTSRGGRLFIQAKRTLAAEAAAASDFAATLDQFVRQHLLGCREGGRGRPLDPGLDRLVLVTGPGSPATIRQVLGGYLIRARDLLPGQTIDPSELTEAQREIHEKVVCHAESSWRRAVGVSPSGTDLADLLRPARVLVLDVEPGGAQEREAKGILRSSILADPGQAEAAWSHLTRMGLDFGSDRLQADRLRLQEELRRAGINLRAARSYRADVDRLCRYSRRVEDALASTSAIRQGGRVIHVDRPVVATLVAEADGASLLVVGEPGAGKSSVLVGMARDLRGAGRDVVYLDVARVEAATEAALRGELGLEHDLADVLANWPGPAPGVLIVDALDAARSEGSAVALRGLIAEVTRLGGRWRVVASIRTYEARYGHALRATFAGGPVAGFADPDLRGLRHASVPAFGEAELDQVAAQSPALAALLGGAPAPLRDLLRNPYNLGLAAEALDAGVAAAALVPIGTQVELLDRYWACRVVGEAGGDAREIVLRAAAEAMVRGRRLRAGRDEVAVGVGADAPLRQLLRSQVLVEWRPGEGREPERYILAFAHHVLFDYAVATLLLRGEPGIIATRLAAEPDLALAIRPSLAMAFRSAWLRDPTRALFWGMVLRLYREEAAPEIGRLIGPGVAAEMLGDARDCDPLFVALEGAEFGARREATGALWHLVGAFRVLPAPSGPWPASEPWCRVVDRASRTLTSLTSPAVAHLLDEIRGRLAGLTGEQVAVVAGAARRLLEYAWTLRPRNLPLVRIGLDAVCTTLGASPGESGPLLLRSLDPAHLSEHGHQELSILARHAGTLAAADPGLAVALYSAAFGHRDRDEAPTDLGTGQILSLRSNRRQDYEMGLFSLGEAFPGLLSLHPAVGTRALIAVVAGCLRVEQDPALQSESVTFDFDGRAALIEADGGGFGGGRWACSLDPQDRMLIAFQDHLMRVRAGEGRRAIMDVVVAENPHAAIWRRVLAAGAAAPATLGREILPLAYAGPILAGVETSGPASSYIAAMLGTLEAGEVRRIEGVVLALAEEAGSLRREGLGRLRDHLLRILAGWGQHSIQEVGTPGHARTGEGGSEEWARSAFGPGPVSPEDYEVAYEAAVDLREPANRGLRDAVVQVREFARDHLNTDPSRRRIEGILPAIHGLCEMLRGDAGAAAHPCLADLAWGELAAAAARVARSPEFAAIDGCRAPLIDILLEASGHRRPVAVPASQDPPEGLVSWTYGDARVEAAQGLMSVARGPIAAEDSVAAAIRRLAGDPVPAVRLQVARALPALRRDHRELMWELASRFLAEESRQEVLANLVRSLWSSADEDGERVAPFAITALARASEFTRSEDLLGHCLAIMVHLLCRGDHAEVRAAVDRLCADPAGHAPELQMLLFHLRPSLTYGPVDWPDPRSDAIRHRAFDVVRRILDRVGVVAERIRLDQAGWPVDEPWPQVVQHRLRDVYSVAFHLCRELYFASGAFQGGAPTPDGASLRLGLAVRRRFLQEARDSLDRLIRFGTPQVAHHLVEILASLAEFDARGTLLMLGRVVSAAEAYGYQGESLGAALVVGLVERYLSDYPELLYADVEARDALRGIMDVFVRAGWPEALRMTHRLDGIFR